MVTDYRSAGSLSEWLRQRIAGSPNLAVEELLAMAAAEAPRSWRMGQKEPIAIARTALGRLVRSGEAEVVDGRVRLARRFRASRASSNLGGG
jgi:hypothetical protein